MISYPTPSTRRPHEACYPPFALPACARRAAPSIREHWLCAEQPPPRLASRRAERAHAYAWTISVSWAIARRAGVSAGVSPAATSKIGFPVRWSTNSAIGPGTRRPASLRWSARHRGLDPRRGGRPRDTHLPRLGTGTFRRDAGRHALGVRRARHPGETRLLSRVPLAIDRRKRNSMTARDQSAIGRAPMGQA